MLMSWFYEISLFCVITGHSLNFPLFNFFSSSEEHISDLPLQAWEGVTAQEGW